MHLDKQIIAEYNRGCVLELVAKKGPINRSEIARQLKLSIPTIMKIADEFSAAGIFRITGKGESAGGKRPELYEVVRDAYSCIGVDVGRSKINILLVDLLGGVVDRHITDTIGLKRPEEFVEVINNVVEEIIQTNKVQMEKLIGIGIGIPGIIDKTNGMVLYSPDFDWENIDILTPIHNKFKKQVAIENSNRTMALGEQWIGAGANANNIFCINVGHGIGAAILDRDKIYTGSSGSSGEFGHTVMIKDGPVCDCGNRGCLEAVASGNAIAKKMGKREAKEVFDLMRQGNTEAAGIIKEAMEYLGIGIAGAINLLDPDMCILSGGVIKSYDLFQEDLINCIKAHQMKFVGRNVKIRVGELGENASAIGAANLLLKRFRDLGGQIG